VLLETTTLLDASKFDFKQQRPGDVAESSAFTQKYLQEGLATHLALQNSTAFDTKD
jgi:hypothetical protein